LTAFRAVWLAVFCGLILFYSCSLRIIEPDRFPEAVRLHNVEPYLEEPEQCGPYALAAVQNFMGIEADADEMSERLYSSGAGGTLTMDLYLESVRSGLPARQATGMTSTLRDGLDSDPVIVLFRYPALVGGSGHFIVVTGYSLKESGFFILWGDGRLSWMDEKRFQSMWSESGRWMLLFDGKVDP
jgi:hypothetical protein